MTFKTYVTDKFSFRNTDCLFFRIFTYKERTAVGYAKLHWSYPWFFLIVRVTADNQLSFRPRGKKESPADARAGLS